MPRCHVLADFRGAACFHAARYIPDALLDAHSGRHGFPLGEALRSDVVRRCRALPDGALNAPCCVHHLDAACRVPSDVPLADVLLGGLAHANELHPVRESRQDAR